jgi:hypothetical protein
MNGLSFVSSFLLLAQHKGGAVDPSKLPRSMWESPWFAVLIIAAIAIASIIAYVVKRHYDAKLEPGYANDEELFTDLCQAHSLDAAKIALLRELATHHELTDEPARLFIEQGRFTEGLSAELNAKIDDLSKLREQLFAMGA